MNKLKIYLLSEAVSVVLDWAVPFSKIGPEVVLDWEAAPFGTGAGSSSGVAPANIEKKFLQESTLLVHGRL